MAQETYCTEHMAITVKLESQQPLLKTQEIQDEGTAHLLNETNNSTSHRMNRVNLPKQLNSRIKKGALPSCLIEVYDQEAKTMHFRTIEAGCFDGKLELRSIFKSPAMRILSLLFEKLVVFNLRYLFCQSTQIGRVNSRPKNINVSEHTENHGYGCCTSSLQCSKHEYVSL